MARDRGRSAKNSYDMPDKQYITKETHEAMRASAEENGKVEQYDDWFRCHALLIEDERF